MAQPKKNKKPRGKPPKGAPSPQPGPSVPGGSLEFPPPPQEILPLDSSAESEITEPAVFSGPLSSSSVHYNPGSIPESGGTESVDVRVPKRSFISADYAYKEGLPEENIQPESGGETLSQTREKIRVAIGDYLMKLIKSETGIGMVKKKIVPAFFKDKDFSDEEVGEIVGRFDSQKMKNILFQEAYKKVDGYFAQENALISEIWQDEKLSGSAIGTIYAAFNAAVEGECRRILAEKEAKKEKDTAQDKGEKFEKIMKKIFEDPENERKINMIGNGIREKLYKVWLESSEQWEGYSEEDAKLRVTIDTKAAINIAVESMMDKIFGEIKDAKEKAGTREALAEYLSKIVFEENKIS